MRLRCAKTAERIETPAAMKTLVFAHCKVYIRQMAPPARVIGTLLALDAAFVKLFCYFAFYIR